MYIIGKSMNALEAYKIYLSIKLHFQRATYDITKHGMRANMPAEKFEAKTNMKLIFGKLARKYKKKELINIIVFNFATGDKFGGFPYDGEAIEVYKQTKARRERLSYNFEQDLLSIQTRMEQDNILDATQGDHPLILKMLLGKQVSLETVVILNRLLEFINDYSDDMILGDTCLLVSKYSPFVKKDTKSLTDKHESLINIIARQRVLSNTNNIT